MTHCNALATLVRLAVLRAVGDAQGDDIHAGRDPRSLGSSEPIKPAMAVPCCERWPWDWRCCRRNRSRR